MKPLRSFLDKLEPLFTKGGRFEQFYALFEAVDTFLFSPPDLTRGSPHVRDTIDLKRVMILVVIASSPAAIMGMWNTGFQANTAIQTLGLVGIDGWRGAVLALLGAGYDPASVYDCFLHGLLYFLPIYIVTMGVGLFWLQGRAEVEKGAPPPLPEKPAANPTVLPSANIANLEGPAPPEASNLTREQIRFFRYDRNRDLRISRNEMLSTRTDAFRKLDKDGNNLLTFEEWAVATVDRFEGADSNRDNELTQREFAATAPKPAQKKPGCSC